jgi:hypothetical protein
MPPSARSAAHGPQGAAGAAEAIVLPDTAEHLAAVLRVVDLGTRWYAATAIAAAPFSHGVAAAPLPSRRPSRLRSTSRCASACP